MNNSIPELEKKYWKAMEEGDFETVKSLTRFPCIVAGKEGVRSVDEVSFRTMFDSGAGKEMKVHNISNTESQVINDTTAIIAYRIELEYKNTPMECACASTWVKENDRWTCAMHTESDLKEGK